MRRLNLFDLGCLALVIIGGVGSAIIVFGEFHV